MTNIDQHKWWTIGEVCQYLRCSKARFHTHYKYLPEFPRPRREGYRSVFFDRDLVKAYFENGEPQ